MKYKESKSFYLALDMGDVIYSLLFCKIFNVHRIALDTQDANIKFNQNCAEFLLPLLQHQEYLKDIKLSSEKNNYDCAYGIHPNNIPVVVGTNLTAYHASKFEIHYEDEILHKPWLIAPTDKQKFKNKKILINRTSRYHGNDAFYLDFLKHIHPKQLLFAGLEIEHKEFCKQYNIDIDYIKTDNSLELAKVINSIPTFVGNESLICAIATGLGKSCFIEYGRGAANYIFERQNIIYF
tara:strand:- start:3410 stop:4120 length:711 start_codon:yes stop_codon:yes gene_type:complete